MEIALRDSLCGTEKVAHALALCGKLGRVLCDSRTVAHAVAGTLALPLLDIDALAQSLCEPARLADSCAVALCEISALPLCSALAVRDTSMLEEESRESVCKALA